MDASRGWARLMRFGCSDLSRHALLSSSPGVEMGKSQAHSLRSRASSGDGPLLLRLLPSPPHSALVRRCSDLASLWRRFSLCLAFAVAGGVPTQVPPRVPCRRPADPLPLPRPHLSLQRVSRRWSHWQSLSPLQDRASRRRGPTLTRTAVAPQSPVGDGVGGART